MSSEIKKEAGKLVEDIEVSIEENKIPTEDKNNYLFKRSAKDEFNKLVRRTADFIKENGLGVSDKLTSIAIEVKECGENLDAMRLGWAFEQGLRKGYNAPATLGKNPFRNIDLDFGKSNEGKEVEAYELVENIKEIISEHIVVEQGVGGYFTMEALPDLSNLALRTASFIKENGPHPSYVVNCIAKAIKDLGDNKLDEDSLGKAFIRGIKAADNPPPPKRNPFHYMNI